MADENAGIRPDTDQSIEQAAEDLLFALVPLRTRILRSARHAPAFRAAYSGLSGALYRGRSPGPVVMPAGPKTAALELLGASLDAVEALGLPWTEVVQAVNARREAGRRYEGGVHEALGRVRRTVWGVIGSQRP
ncbi:MAG: hypothetical protein ACLFV8_14065 [Alphaproteobacteria bacterium]